MNEFINRIKETVQTIEPKAEVILFGSRARGEGRNESDWDILILVPHAVDLKVEQQFRHKLFEVELEYGQAISTFVFSKTEWHDTYSVTPLYKNVKLEGVRL